jgi:UDPglucose 6-dehydrogenase
MKIAVLGLWHLGSVTAACLASVGHDVVGIDDDPAVIDRLADGRPPLFEPGLEDLVRAGLRSGRLWFTTDIAQLREGVELLWVTRDTPVDADDRADVDSVMRQVVSALPHLTPGATVLVSSQMPVGSISRLEAAARSVCPGSGLRFACSPENLRLGKAIEAFLVPDRIVVGIRSGEDRDRIARLLAPITERIEWMRVESAEMTKHAINAFLATSVVFANEVATLCELVGADAKEVERGLKTEQRIGPRAYLGPGAAFAGGTLARDIEFLKDAGRTGRLELPLLQSVRTSNDAHKGWVLRRLQTSLGELRGQRIAIWGLTYKPGTDTLRRSLAVELCDRLLALGASLVVHDPVVADLPAAWSGRVDRADDPLASLDGAAALVIATEWPMYRDIPGAAIAAAAAPGLLVVDPNRFLGRIAGSAGLRHAAVGTAPPEIRG